MRAPLFAAIAISAVVFSSLGACFDSKTRPVTLPPAPCVDRRPPAAPLVPDADDAGK